MIRPRAFLILGAYGDICAVLPIIYDEFKNSGRRQPVVVSRDYKDIFEGCSYVEPVPFEGHYSQLAEAVLWARNRFENLTVLQTYNNHQGHFEESFVHQMWKNGGRKFDDKLPLVFDRRNRNRESALAEGHECNGQLILVAANSNSVKFPFPDDLRSLISSEFPDKTVVKLDNVHAENIIDLIGLYDRAAVIVSVDTAHLHLSRASSTPVISLATDKPDSWYGTPQYSNQILRIPYGQYQERRQEITNAIHNVLSPIKTKRIDHLAPNGYNPGMIDLGDRLLLAYRWHWEPNWRTRITIAEIDYDFKLIRASRIHLPPEVDNMSTEDPRLFMHNDELWMSYTVVRPNEPKKCILGYGRLQRVGQQWTLMEHIQPVYGQNDWQHLEKNWVFFSRGMELKCIYATQPNQVILTLDGDRVTKIEPSKSPSWRFGAIHGGTPPVLFKGDYVRFFHSRTFNGTQIDQARPWDTWCYHIGAIIQSSKPPFKVKEISKTPIISGDTRWVSKCAHWKQRVAFAAGLVVRGDELWLSYGVNDSACYIARLTKKDLNL